MKRTIILLLFFLLVRHSGFTQVDVRHNNTDSSRVYFPVKFRDGSSRSFLRIHDEKILKDSLTFYNLLDSLGVSEFPDIDFSEYEVGIENYCAQCEAVCHHEIYNGNRCHRNACLYMCRFYKKKK